MANRTDITRWMTEYDPENIPGYWHFPFTTANGIEPAVNMGAVYGRHNVGFTDPAGKTREVTEGPEVPGPRACAYGKTTAITANPEHGTWGEVRRNEAAGAEIHASFGDELVIFGYVYRIERAPNRNIRLVLADDSNGLASGQMNLIRLMTRKGIETSVAYELATEDSVSRRFRAAAAAG
jgi:hypothetical protein